MSPDGLPIGCQLTGRMWEEGTLIRAGSAFEQATDWHARMPSGALARA